MDIGDSQSNGESSLIIGQEGEKRDFLRVLPFEDASFESFSEILVRETMDDFLRCVIVGIAPPRVQDAREPLRGEGCLVFGGDEVVGEGEAVSGCDRGEAMFDWNGVPGEDGGVVEAKGLWS